MLETRLVILLCTLLLLVLSQACSAASAPVAREFYVGPKGSDKNPGTKAKPFASLEKAKDAIRTLKKTNGLPDGGITVWILGGVYPIGSSFVLNAEDSGTKDAPITYRGIEGEEIRLVGGQEITGFKPVTDPKILERLDESARGKVLQVDLKAQGIADLGKMSGRGFGRPIVPAGLELFFQDKPMTLARWPNEGWARIAAVPAGKDGGKFTYSGDRPSRWTKSDDIWLHGFWTHDWADTYEKVSSIDTKTREIYTHPPHGQYGYTEDRRYYALNLLEELDQPGEWYLDRGTGVLYFWPPAPIRQGKTVVSLLEKPLISMDGASFVTIRGLTLECTRGHAVQITGGTRNLVAGCTIRNIGNIGVKIKEGTENGVRGCDIYETGDGGIWLEGGNREKLTPASNYAENNNIHNYSRWVITYRPGVQMRGVGNRVAHNLIHDAPHCAIIFKGNEHIIEFNEIHNVCSETADAGAFYIGRDWTQRGNVIRFNYFHHLMKNNDLRGWSEIMAVYLDDCASGTRIYGNIFHKAARAVMIGGGRDNVVQNNVFVDCTPALHVDARGIGWASFWFDGRDNTLMDGLKAMNHKEPPYSVRYPELLTLLDDEPAMPKGNSIICNIFSGGERMQLLNNLTEDILEMRDNLTEGDPGFVDPANGNFQLRDDSPAYKLGFKRIPMDKIGLYVDKYRPTLPRAKR